MGTETEEVLLEQVNRQRLMDYTKKISEEIRLSGSEAEMRAFTYVKSTLESFGLKTELYLREALISLPESAVLQVDGEIFPAITHSMAPSTGEQGLTAELVYAGTGSDEEYEKVNVEGRIVLLEGLAIPGAVWKAEKKSAAGIIFINAKYTHEMIVSTIWGNPTPEKMEFYPKIPVVSISYDNGNIIKERLRQSERIAVWLKTKVDTGWRQIPTLTAEIKGKQEPEKFVLFSGHIDSWHYGAMDNGSANAVMIEVARILSQEKLDLRRSLRLVFWSGHSHGRYAGSALYADEHWEELYDHCIMHINIDSVGAKDAVVLSEGNCMAETKDLARSVIRELTGEIYEGTRFGRAGDQSFWGTGVPSLFMGLSEQKPSADPASQAFSRLFGGGKGGGFGWWWHTTEDTLDKIDPSFLERDCKIYLKVIFQACTREILPLNQLAAIKELKQYLENYQELGRGHIDLELALQRIAQLEKAAANIYQWMETHSLRDEEIRTVNEWMMKVSKGLVRLNYVNADEFDHDPALSQPAVPLLSGIYELEKVKQIPEKYFPLITSLKRKINKLNFILRNILHETLEAEKRLLGNRN